MSIALIHADGAVFCHPIFNLGGQDEISNKNEHIFETDPHGRLCSLFSGKVRVQMFPMVQEFEISETYGWRGNGRSCQYNLGKAKFEYNRKKFYKLGLNLLHFSILIWYFFLWNKGSSIWFFSSMGIGVTSKYTQGIRLDTKEKWNHKECRSRGIANINATSFLWLQPIPAYLDFLHVSQLRLETLSRCTTRGGDEELEDSKNGIATIGQKGGTNDVSEWNHVN